MTRSLKILISSSLLFALPVWAQTADQIAAYEARIEEQQRQLDEMRAELEALKRAAGIASEAPPAPAPAEKPESVVASRSDKSSFKIGGRIHRVLMNVDDGVSNTGLFIDSDQGPTMLRADGTKVVSDELTLTGTIEFGVQNNRSFRVSQDNPNPGTDMTVRIGELVADHKRFGKFSFGRGFASAWVVAETDLSGTVPAALLPVGMLAPAMKFTDANTSQLTDIQVNQYFIDVERLLLTDRFRYDSPAIGNGLRLSGSLAPDGRWDAAARFFPKFEGWTVRSALTFQQKPAPNISDRVDVYLSARHNDSGLSLTGGWANTKLTGGGDTDSWVLKAGWLTELNNLGSTGFSIDYFSGIDQRLAGDESHSIGLFVMQKWAEVGLDFYGGYRIFDVSRPDVALKDLNIIALGAIFNF